MAQVAVLFVELDLAYNAESTEIRYDIRLPVIRSVRRRQFDAVVESRVNEHDFLRVIEVPRRKEPVGIPQLESWIGKARSVGAHRLTVVAGAFRGTTAKRIDEESDFLQAYELRPATPEDWPDSPTPPPIRVTARNGTVVLDPPAFYYGLVGAGGARRVRIQTLTADGEPALLAVLEREDDDARHASFHPLRRGSRPLELSNAYARIVDDDGNESIVRSGTARVRNWDLRGDPFPTPEHDSND